MTSFSRVVLAGILGLGAAAASTPAVDAAPRVTSLGEVASACAQTLKAAEVGPYQVDVLVARVNLDPEDRAAAAAAESRLRDATDPVDRLNHAKLKVALDSHHPKRVSESAYWMRNSEQMFYQRLRGFEEDEGAGRQEWPPYQYWMDGTRTQMVYADTGLVQVTYPEDTSQLGAGVYPLGLIGKLLSVVARCAAALTSSDAQWEQDVSPGGLVLRDQAALVFDGFGMLWIPKRGDLVRVETETSGDEASVEITLERPQVGALSSWRFVVASSGWLRFIEAGDYFLGSSARRETISVTLAPAEWHDRSAECPLILPAEWKCIDARAGRHDVITGRGGRLPPDATLLVRQRQSLAGRTPVAGAPGAVEVGPDRARVVRVTMFACVLAAAVGTVFALRRLRRGSATLRVAVGVAVLLLGLVGVGTLMPSPELARQAVQVSSPADLSGLRLDDQVLVAGPVQPGARQVVETGIRNTRQDAVVVESIETSCGCEVASVVPRELPPGGTARIQVTLHNTLGVGPRTSRILARCRARSGELIDLPLAVRSDFLKGLQVVPQVRALTARASDLTEGKAVGVWELRTDVGVLESVESVEVWPTWLDARLGPAGTRSTPVTVVCRHGQGPAGVAPGVLSVRLADGRVLEAQFVLDVVGKDRVGTTESLFRVQSRVSTAFELPSIELQGIRQIVRVEAESGLEPPAFSTTETPWGLQLKGGRTRFLGGVRSRGQVTLAAIASDGSEQTLALYFLFGPPGD